MNDESGQLLLRPGTTVTCPKCSNEFSLDLGFAKKALEQLSEGSSSAIAAMREAERAVAFVVLEGQTGEVLTAADAGNQLIGQFAGRLCSLMLRELLQGSAVAAQCS